MSFSELFGVGSSLNRLSDLIKIGEVSSINPEKGTARVVFDDDNGLISYDLPILQRNTLRTKDFHSVNVGEDVLCLFLPSGPEEGFILGSFYAGEIVPPESTEKRRTTVFEDGTLIRYDMESHVLTALIEGTSIVADRSSVSINTPDSINEESVTINIKGSSQVNVEGGSVVNVKGGAAINLTAPAVTLTMGGSTMKLNGSSCTIDTAQMNVTGSLKVDGDVTAGGISLMSHTHTCPDGKTSAPQ